MKKIVFSLFVLVLLALAACDKTTNQQATQQGDSTEANKEENPEEKVSFSKNLGIDKFNFIVSTLGEDDKRKLKVRAEKEGKLFRAFEEQIEGKVTDAIHSDLNNDKNPELLIFVNGISKDVYGTVYGYEFSDKNYTRLSMPALSEEATKGYLGQDEYKVEENKLIRTFLIMNEKEKSGGSRKISYTLDKLEFKAEKHKDLN